MKALFLLLLALLAGNSALAAPPWRVDNGPPAWQAEAPPPHRLRDLRLREAVERGELTREEARAARWVQGGRLRLAGGVPSRRRSSPWGCSRRG